MPTVAFALNGREVVVEHDEGEHLLEVLRERLGITSPKDGCSPQGTCGCCTVLVDGRPALACLLEPAWVAGRAVTTLEGLPEPRRELLAASFVAAGAVQCGFCTPGIAIRASHLVDRGLTTDRDRVRRALAGHLCRCTGYHRIVDAIQLAGSGGPCEPPATGHGIGASSPRYRGRELVLGARPFVADLKVDGMLHGALVLSAHPRARVVGIDLAPALASRGAVAVLTAADIPGKHRHGLIVEDWPLLVAVGETTRYIGDILAVVVADTQHRAHAAAARLGVEYEVLEPVTDPELALDPAAPAVHQGGNLLELCSYRYGDVGLALAASAHTVEATFRTQRVEHAFLEPEAALALPDGDRLTVFSQGQGVHDDRRQIAAILGLDPERVRVELVPNGGAFGGKEDLSVQGHAALAAWHLGRPVRIVLTRSQSLRIHPKRHPLTLRYRAGCDAEGRLTAVEARIVGDTGAYASVGAKVLERAAGHACGPYRVPAVDVEARTVYTNNPPCGAMRGFGANQAAFAIEGVLDRLADKVGLDGYDIRERNVLSPGDRFATGQRMTASCGIRRTLEAVRETYKSARVAGIACGIKNTGIGNGLDDIGRVLIEVVAGGRLSILTGYTEMGQGLYTILRQVVSEETGLDPEIMEVATASDPRVECGMTTASRATALCTAAGRRAAARLASALDSGSLDDLAGESFLGEIIVDITTPPGADVDDPVTHMAFGYATQVVVLGDDGRIDRVIAAHDVGRAVNPQLCSGQVEGAVHMGLGSALSEDFPCTGGVPDSLLLRDLGILRAADTPSIEVILVEVADEIGGYGAKGVGEIGLVPTAGAVAGALHALDGCWRDTLPMRGTRSVRQPTASPRR
jgi:xanthine dehydrogenase molybdenum-binding subunit